MDLRLTKPWLSLLLLCTLLQAPVLLDGASGLGPSTDVPALIALWLLGARLGARGRLLRFTMLLGIGVLTFHALDRALLGAFMGEQPLLYDQLFMVRHLIVLVRDLWSIEAAALLVAVPIAIGLCVLLVRALLERSLGVLGPEQRRARSIALPCLAGLLVAAAALELIGRPYLSLASAALTRDVIASRQLYLRVQRSLRTAAYDGHRGVRLQRRPDIMLVLVESYGRIMVTHPALRRPLRDRLAQMERALAVAGWYGATSFSTAPVVGGRSWLAEASILLGMRVSYEAEFHQLTAQRERLPSLVRWLGSQGYHRVLLAPADRVRPGVEEVDYYGYDRSVRLADLDYRGPTYGWGIVPDQYSLGHTEEHVLRSAPRPLFFNFHMVSSHAPWQAVPKLVADWRTLSSGAAASSGRNQGQLLARLKRYGREHDRFPTMGKIKPAMIEGYRDAILYELELLERHLAGVDGDALVIVIGDHQPPFLSRHTKSYETPVHVLARDPALLRELLRHGFSHGLQLAVRQPPVVRHEGLFPLLVKSLARCCGE